MTKIGQDEKTGKFTQDALRRQTQQVLSGEKKIKVVHPDVPVAEPSASDWWLIRYDDAEVEPEVIQGEAIARKAFVARLLTWNCQLFKMVDDGKRRASAPTGGEDDGKRHSELLRRTNDNSTSSGSDDGNRSMGGCEASASPSGDPVAVAQPAMSAEPTEKDGAGFADWAVKHYGSMDYGDDSTEEIAIKYASQQNASLRDENERLKKALRSLLDDVYGALGIDKTAMQSEAREALSASPKEDKS